MNKKQKQLGIDPGTATYRLLKDLLFDFVIKSGHVCYRCSKPLTRETFSIDHKEPWLDSYNPVYLFFDLSNIAFSHNKCNGGAARKPTKKYKSPQESNKARQKRKWAKLTKEQRKLNRRKRWEKYHK